MGGGVFVSCFVTMAGMRVELHAAGVIWLPAQQLMCASDIHFEKASFFHRFGSLLPTYDTTDTLERLEQVIDALKPQHFIALGDSFHDAAAASRMNETMIERINRMVASVSRWQWVLGNHDPAIEPSIMGERCEEAQLEGLSFRHELTNNAGAEISGHYHPKAECRVAGRTIRGACFAQRHDRLVMPAFGTFTGGLSVNDRAFLKVMPADARRLFMLHRGYVVALPEVTVC